MKPILRRAAVIPSRLLIAMLMAVNYPLRFVPASSRGNVNIVAMSLVVWAPIVWLLAIFAAPRWQEARQAARSAHAIAVANGEVEEEHTSSSQEAEAPSGGHGGH